MRQIFLCYNGKIKIAKRNKSGLRRIFYHAGIQIASTLAICASLMYKSTHMGKRIMSVDEIVEKCRKINLLEGES